MSFSSHTLWSRRRLMRRRRRRQVLRRGWSRHCSGVCSRRLPRWRTGSRLCTGCLSNHRPCDLCPGDVLHGLSGEHHQPILEDASTSPTLCMSLIVRCKLHRRSTDPTPEHAGAWAEAAGAGLRERGWPQAGALPQAGAWPEASSPADAPGAACHRSRKATDQGTCTNV